jgi:uncharacterized UPF0160 family protein
VINKLERIIKALTIAMEKPEIANALIQRVINELNKNKSGPSLYIAWDNGELKHSLTGEPNTDFEWTALYAVPLKKEWVGFTQEEHLSASWTDGSFGAGFLHAEKLLKEKNNG